MILSIEGSDEFVSSSAASIATGQVTLPRWGFHPLKHTRLHGARTHDLIRILFRFWAAFLGFEDTTYHFLQTTKESFVSQRPASATVPAQVPEFPLGNSGDSR